MGHLLHKEDDLAVAESSDTAVKTEYKRTKVYIFKDPKQNLVSVTSSMVSKLPPRHDRCADMNENTRRRLDNHAVDSFRQIRTGKSHLPLIVPESPLLEDTTR